MSQSAEAPFGKLRSFFWPIYRYELKKILPMLLMFFFINFNYTILRDAKDGLVITATGPETVLFLKTWGVVPCAMIFMLGYAKLSNVLSREKLFYAALTPFIIFFALFPTVLYPAREFLHPHQFADTIQSYLPQGLHGLISCFRNWTFSLFYILAELWGSAALSLMFWGFANEITKISEAKRFYTLFGVGANIAMLISGPLITKFSAIRDFLPPGVDAWQVTLNYLMTFVVIAGLCVMAIYRWMQLYVLTDSRFYDPANIKSGKKSKPSLSIKDSFSFLMKSKYILCIGLLVIGYNMSINLVEVSWKGQLRLQYPNPNDYLAFMGMFSFFTGLTTIVMLFVGGFIIRKKGWGFAAAVTPVVLLVTGSLFFSFILFRGAFQEGFDQPWLLPIWTLMGITSQAAPLFLAVLFGMIQNIMSKSSKYSLFDPTKEMAYIPLDQESKVKGKAAIDVVVSRFGKSGGAFIQQGLVIVFGSVAAITPYVAVCMVCTVVAWLFAVRTLNRQFVALTVSEPAEKATNQQLSPANA